MENVLVTGISSGIGAALAQALLARGHRVCGLSRRLPDAPWAGHPSLHAIGADLTDFTSVAPKVRQLCDMAGIAGFDTVFANAGTFGPPPARAERVAAQDFMAVLALNAGGVKATLDACLALPQRPRRVVASASISGQRQRAGMLSYATSKAALNALMMTYQIENPDIFFLPLGLCNVATPLGQVTIQAGPELPELYALRQRASQPGYVVTPDERAAHVLAVLDHAAGLEPGRFREIRDLLTSIPDPLQQKVISHDQ